MMKRDTRRQWALFLVFALFVCMFADAGVVRAANRNDMKGGGEEEKPPFAFAESGSNNIKIEGDKATITVNGEGEATVSGLAIMLNNITVSGSSVTGAGASIVEINESDNESVKYGVKNEAPGYFIFTEATGTETEQAQEPSESEKKADISVTAISLGDNFLAQDNAENKILLNLKIGGAKEGISRKIWYKEGDMEIYYPIGVINVQRQYKVNFYPEKPAPSETPSSLYTSLPYIAGKGLDSLPPQPSETAKEPLVFAGWMEGEDSKEISAGSTENYVGNRNLYARWKGISVSAEPGVITDNNGNKDVNFGNTQSSDINTTTKKISIKNDGNIPLEIVLSTGNDNFKIEKISNSSLDLDAGGNLALTISIQNGKIGKLEDMLTITGKETDQDKNKVEIELRLSANVVVPSSSSPALPTTPSSTTTPTPTKAPTVSPSSTPTPTKAPTASPSSTPTPTKAPIASPSSIPTPTKVPTGTPTSSQPSAAPTGSTVTATPSATPEATVAPTPSQPPTTTPPSPKYTISFKDGDKVKKIEVESGTALKEVEEVTPKDPAEEGCKFDGWYTEEGKKYDPETIVKEDMTFIARWSYTVTFMDKDESGNYSITCATGSAVSGQALSVDQRPADPEKEGYEFTGWYTDKECKNEFDLDTPITSALLLYAGWKPIAPKKHTVTFMSDNEIYETISVVSGNKLDVPPKDPLKEGYTFNGWYTDKECKDMFDFGTPITSDITLYAGWVKNPLPTTKPTLAPPPAPTMPAAGAPELQVDTKERYIIANGKDSVSLTVKVNGSESASGYSYAWYILGQTTKLGGDQKLKFTSKKTGTYNVFCRVTDNTGTTYSSAAVPVICYKNKLGITVKKTAKLKSIFGSNIKIKKMQLKSKKDKKFLEVKSGKGTMKAKKYTSKTIKVIIKTRTDKKLTIKVSLSPSKPTVKVTVKKSPARGCVKRVIFKYKDVSGATKMRVRTTGKTNNAMKKFFDKYLSKPSKGYIDSTKRHATYKFKVWALYGKVKSPVCETRKIKW